MIWNSVFSICRNAGLHLVCKRLLWMNKSEKNGRYLIIIWLNPEIFIDACVCVNFCSNKIYLWKNRKKCWILRVHLWFFRFALLLTCMWLTRCGRRTRTDLTDIEEGWHFRIQITRNYTPPRNSLTILSRILKISSLCLNHAELT